MENVNNYGKDKWLTIIAWSMYFIVNLVFCIKYNPVAEIKPLYIIVLYPLIVLGIYKLTTYKDIQLKKYFYLITAFFILLLAILLMANIDKYSVDVDRWSALAFWSENLKNGLYPYGTPTHLGGYASPYPVWQLFHFPFHLMGDTGYGQIFCLLVFFIFLFAKRNRVNAGGFILLMALSPGFWWEMSVRSDLLCNMLLVYIFLSYMFYYPQWEKYKYWIGLLIGLFLCTKMLVAIPLFIYFFPKWLTFKTKEKIGFALVVILGLVGPFIPLLFGENSILYHPEYNPILQQTRQGNIWIVVVGFILILTSSLTWKRMKVCFFLSGLFLFLLNFSVGVNIYLSSNLQYVIFGNELDVSYFNVSIPFLLFCINEIRSREYIRF